MEHFRDQEIILAYNGNVERHNEPEWARMVKASADMVTLYTTEYRSPSKKLIKSNDEY